MQQLKYSYYLVAKFCCSVHSLHIIVTVKLSTKLESLHGAYYVTEWQGKTGLFQKLRTSALVGGRKQDDKNRLARQSD